MAQYTFRLSYERPRQLAVCLDAITKLDYPRDRFEVIVDDDGSKLLPADIVNSFRDKLDVTLLVQPNSGPASARNTGALKARGQFIVFTDDDCSPAPDWLQKLKKLAVVPVQRLGAILCRVGRTAASPRRGSHGTCL